MIRVVVDRVPGEVKSAILRALRVLLVKCADALKAFASQLQTTILKGLAEPHDDTRVAAAAALAPLLATGKVSARFEQLLSQVVAAASEYQDRPTFDALAVALRHPLAESLPDAAVVAAQEALFDCFEDVCFAALDDYERSEDVLALTRAVGAAVARTGDSTDLDKLAERPEPALAFAAAEAKKSAQQPQ